MASNSSTKTEDVDSLAELMKKVSLNTFECGSECWVEVTHIKDPHSFYVLPTAYKSYLKDIEGEGDHIEEHDVYLGSLVTFWSNRLQKFVRGQVTHVEPEKHEYNIFSRDYGFTSKRVKPKYIRKAKNNIPLPALALHCKLADCKPIGGAKFSQDAIDAMKYYVNNNHVSKVLKMKIREKKPLQLTVELTNVENIGWLLTMTGYTTFGYVDNTVNRFTTELPEEKTNFTFYVEQFEPNKIINVRIQSGKTLDNFFVADVNDYRKYLDRQGDFTYYCRKFAKTLGYKDLEIYKPVGVFHSGKYERAIIKEIIGETKVLVQMVDWGTTKECFIDHLKVIDREYFFDHPAAAIYCSAATESQPIELWLGLELSLQIKEVGEGFHKPHIVVKVSNKM